MKPVKPRRRFTEAEDAQLEKLRVAGLSLAQIANQMGRARSSIQMLRWPDTTTMSAFQYDARGNGPKSRSIPFSV